MIVRIVIVLVCVVFFINGCNSLISQFFGTHKLRAYTMQEVAGPGIGDADYIRLEDARQNGTFVYQEAEEKGAPPVILYPVFAPDTAKKEPLLLAWTADFHRPCVEAGDCITAQVGPLSGVIRPIPDQNLKAVDLLKAKGYDIPSHLPVINTGEAPVAWYWNALMMLGAALIAFAIEAAYHRRAA